MSIEKITSKIIGDAEESAKVTLAEAKAAADGILAEAQAKAEGIRNAAEKKGAEEKEKLISRKKSVADIDSRKMILVEKQKLISECFDKAAEKIASMEKDAYVEFLTALVLKTGEKEGQLILNEKDAEAIGEALIASIAKADPGAKITLAEERRNILGGFLLKNGQVYINGTIEALVAEAREELTGEAAWQLFQ